MCGIAGFIDYSGKSDEAILRRMTDTMVERGPDSAGYELLRTPHYALGLGHRRLAIIDLTAQGHQPMSTPDSRFTIVLNGEIYNFLELRSELEGRGHHFSGCSDTAVLLAAFSEWGLTEGLTRCVGMFAFALWDRHEQSLHLGRDRMGEKPLYYGWQRNTLLFASDLRAFRKHPAMEARISSLATREFLRYGYVPGKLSIYEGIQKVKAGTLVTIRPGSSRPEASECTEPYWDLSSILTDAAQNPEQLVADDAIDQLDSCLREAVRGQMLADVPLGAFLSGGIDSSTVVAFMQQVSSVPVKTFSVGFYDKAFDEAPFAKRVAEHLGTEHTEVYVTQKHVLDIVPQLSHFYTEPFADASQIPTCLISQITREHVTVSLSGDGGDELCFGYPRYYQNPKHWQSLNRLPLRLTLARMTRNGLYTQFGNAIEQIGLGRTALARWIKRFPVIASASSFEEYYRRSFTVFPNPESFFVDSCQEDSNHSDCLCRISDLPTLAAGLDLLQYLPDDLLVKVDRAAMAFSLETRAPFLDHRFVEMALRLPRETRCLGNELKGLLKHLLYRYVPEELVNRPKRGFSCPMGKWLRDDIKDWCMSLLSDSAIERTNIGFDKKKIGRILKHHMSGKADYAYPLWNLLMFQSWADRESLD